MPRPLLALLSAFALAPLLPAADDVVVIRTTAAITRLARPGTLPDATPSQSVRLTQIRMDLQIHYDTLEAARSDLARASFVLHPSDSTLRAAVEKVALADLALTNARLHAFADFQESPDRGTPEQIQVLKTLLSQPFVPQRVPVWTAVPTPPSSAGGPTAPNPSK